MLEWPSLTATTLTSTPARSKAVAWEWRVSWRRTYGRPARRTALVNSLVTLSGTSGLPMSSVKTWPSACQKPAGQRDCLTAWRRRCYRHRPDRWGPINATQLLSTWTYTLSFGNLDFGQGAAVGTIMMLVSLVCALAYVRSHRRELRR